MKGVQVTPPTLDEIWNEEHPEIDRDLVSKTRWGTIESRIVRRESDNTYWKAGWEVTSDGWQRDTATVVRVEPYEVTVTQYRELG